MKNCDVECVCDCDDVSVHDCDVECGCDCDDAFGDDCAFEVLWETDFACPQSSVMSTNSCVLRNEFVNFDLTPLTNARLTPYMIKHDDVDSQGKTTHYHYYINVCQALVYLCGGLCHGHYI